MSAPWHDGKAMQGTEGIDMHCPPAYPPSLLPSPSLAAFPARLSDLKCCQYTAFSSAFPNPSSVLLLLSLTLPQSHRLLPLPSLAAVLLLLASPASGAYSYPTLRRADPSSTAIVHREGDGKTLDYYHGNSFLTIGIATHRPARVALPENYFQSDKKFPVILVLHGWASNGG